MKRHLRRVLHHVGMVLYRLGYRALRRGTPEWHNRRWSNAELRRVGPLFEGDVLNVSAWKDEDRERGHYADYFPRKASYTVSNFEGTKGLQGAPGEVHLDLEAPVPPELERRFDVVFNHTTLEHVYDIQAAVRALCTLSRDVVIVVVPFAQPVHWEEGAYLDYWRPTPFALQRMFEANEFHLVYANHNLNPVFPVYLFAVAVRDPARWEEHFSPPVLNVPRNFVP